LCSDVFIATHRADECYLAAAVYGTPSLYYAKSFHGDVEIPDEQLQVLGRLFRLSAKRPWGRPRFLSYGNWQLQSRGQIMAQSVDSKALIMLAEDGSGWIFSMLNERIALPLLGRSVCNVEPCAPFTDIRSDEIIADWQRGTIYKLTLHMESQER
jgi:hypothetical protein